MLRCQSDPALVRALRELYSGPRRQLAIDRLRRACYHRLLLFGEPIEPAMARTLVTNLLHGIASPGGSGLSAGQAPPSVRGTD